MINVLVLNLCMRTQGLVPLYCPSCYGDNTVLKNIISHLQGISLYIEDYRMLHNQPQVSMDFDNKCLV